MADSGITKNALASAMKSLMLQKPFSKISVGDICERCEMNRKSFYYHFRDKYDLVNWIYYTEFVETIQSNTYRTYWELLYDVCVYFYDNRRFYTNALQVTGQNSFRSYFHEMLEPVILKYIGEIIPPDDDSMFYVTFFTDAFTSAIERWLTNPHAMPPEKFVRLLKSTVTGFARKIVRELDNEHE